ncbi:MAG TPA: glycosyltransferase, partial [Cytophagales bacterium]|nr:glycosyltransferase [Cytophagales bacterium]
MDLALALLTVYCAVLLYFTFKYISRSLLYLDPGTFTDTVTVIVAYRNEAKHLPELIEDLKRLQHAYPFEVILVNDHSTDESLDIAMRHSGPHFRSLSLAPDVMGKKQALRHAAKQAKGVVLLFTDADCRLRPQWLHLMVGAFARPEVRMVAGPFLYQRGRSMLAFFQHVEQVLLWGFAKTMATLGHPVLCNGANLAVRKETYLSLAARLDHNTPSGDDIFLLQEIKKHGKEAIVYLDHTEAVTSSVPTEEFKTFLHQKIRWASKAGKISDVGMNISGIIFLLCHIYFLYLLVIGYPKAFFIKTLFELFFLLTVYLNQYGKFS